MSHPRETFEVGNRVVYVGLSTPVYGKITAISIELVEDAQQGAEVRIYTIEMDEGGTFTGLSRHLRHAEAGP